MMFALKPSVVAAAVGLVSLTGYQALSVAPASIDAGGSSDRVSYEVSVTNLTRGQIFSPPVVATHSRDLTPLFTLGSPASPELAGVAEDALNQPLIDLLNADNNAFDVKTIAGAGGPIMPGETARVIVEGDPRRFNRISMVGMLVVTNDAFFGINGARLPQHGSTSHRSTAYDAGSEANNERCDYIPGPPCNNPMMRMTTGAEGYVHVHAGIHGIGDLAPSTYDWRSDVVAVRVRRLP